MHDPYFDHRLDPRPIPLLPSRLVRLAGAAVLTLGAIVPLALLTALIGAAEI